VNLFRDEEEIVSSKYKNEDREKYFPTVSTYVRDDLKSKGLRGGYYHKYKSEKKILEYVEYFKAENYDLNRYGIFDHPPGEISILTLGKYKYWKEDENKYTQQHYKSFLSDFNIREQPKNLDKVIYKIPLFEINNTYYIRALFGNFVDNIILDTGADQFVISKNLYNKLKENKMITDDNQSMDMQVASGEEITLQRVFLKSIQLNDLYVENVEAYINTADDISLLGQSFLKRFGKITVDHKLNLLTIEK
jgi:predicted aspartyl protease